MSLNWASFFVLMVYEYKIIPFLLINKARCHHDLKVYCTFLNYRYNGVFSRNTHNKHLKELTDIIEMDQYQGQLYMREQIDEYDEDLAELNTQCGIFQNYYIIKQEKKMSVEQLYSIVLQLAELMKSFIFFKRFLKENYIHIKNIGRGKSLKPIAHKLKSWIVTNDFTCNLYRQEICQLFELDSLSAVTALTNKLQDEGFIMKKENLIRLHKGGYDQHEKGKKTKMKDGYFCEQTCNEMTFNTGLIFNYEFAFKWFNNQLKEVMGLEKYFWEKNNKKSGIDRTNWCDYIISGKYLYRIKVKCIAVVEKTFDKSTGELIAENSYDRIWFKSKITGKVKPENIKYKQIVYDWETLLDDQLNLTEIVTYNDQFKREKVLTEGKVKQFKYMAEK